MKPIIILVSVLTLVIVLAQSTVTLTHAAGVITDCSNDIDFSIKLAGDGLLTFDCGTATIPFTFTKIIHSDTTIDGGDKITLSGESLRLFIVNPGVTFTLRNIVLEKGYGSDDNGGAITSAGHMILDHVTMRSNRNSLFNGGAIYTTGPVDIFNSTFAHNKAESGGAIYAEGVDAHINITDSLFDDNSAIVDPPIANGGGAIYLADEASMDSARSRFTANRTNGNGGGIFSWGKVGLYDATLSRNSAQGGGGILNAADLELYNVTLDANTSYSGGAIGNLGNAILTNVTLSGNSSENNGGAMYSYHAGAILTNVTLSGNWSTLGTGGIHNDEASTTLTNTLIAKGKSGANCEGVTDGDFNLSDDNSCRFGVGHGNVNLLLGPLANNGGGTKTHLPQTGSPAIDNGTIISTVLTDQRGVHRPQGTRFDVGAVEVQPAPPTPTATATRTATATNMPTETPTRTATPPGPTCEGKPAKPMLLKPGNTKRVKQPNVKLDWEDALCVTTYQVIVRNGSETGPHIFKQGGLTESKTTTRPLLKGETYFWRVKAINAFGKSKSVWYSFQVK